MNYLSDPLRYMYERMKNALTLEAVKDDFRITFEALGVSESGSRSLVALIEYYFNELNDLRTIERNLFENCIQVQIGGLTLPQKLEHALAGRAKIIYSQIVKHLMRYRTIDFGCGDGQVTQKVKRYSSIPIIGCDVRYYPAKGVNIPIMIFDGSYTGFEDETFAQALVTNVLHHDPENDRVVKELTRITYRRIVMIETVPVGDTTEEIAIDHERTFANDYLYNRIFHPTADVPVPGTYETATGWIERFRKYGWKCTYDENLGYDQPAIRDVHHLYVFER